jgi:hypothetical protein
MDFLLSHPFLVLVVSLITLALAAQAGDYWRTHKPPSIERDKDDFAVIVGATMTLLGLIIGFTFSMAVSRYDQRKNYEEEEANAIGTEYARAELLPAGDVQNVQSLLKQYVHQRMLFYHTRDTSTLATIDAETGRLQNEMWESVRNVAAKQPTPVVALVVAGMNDVLNTQGYTQAAWWNRIPAAAWGLMFAIAVCGNFLIGNGARRKEGALLLVFPLVVAISFFLIADIDSPRGGVIRVAPRNMEAVAHSMNAE